MNSSKLNAQYNSEMEHLGGESLAKNKYYVKFMKVNSDLIKMLRDFIKLVNYGSVFCETRFDESTTNKHCCYFW